MGKTYGRTWRHAGCIIRRRGDRYQVERFLSGRRRRETKETAEEAEKLAVAWDKEVRADGETALTLDKSDRFAAVDLLRIASTEADRLDVKTAFSLLRGNPDRISLQRPLPSPLAEAVRFWLWHHPTGQTPPSMEEAFEAYLVKKSGRRPTTLGEYRFKIRRFIRDNPGLTIADVTPAVIDNWLATRIETPLNRRKYLTVLHGFFKYVCQTYRLHANPTDGVYLDAGETDQSEAEAYAVEEVARIMAAAEKHEQAARIVPVLAIGFFAGLRPAEILGLDWSNVSLEQRTIRVTPATAKRRRQRYVAIADNLAAWLRPYAKTEGRVSPAKITCKRDRRDVLKAAKVARWIKDGLRHSFGTYHLAAYGDANRTAMEMGHRGNTDLVYQHYRKLVTQSEGLAFWLVSPQAKS